MYFFIDKSDFDVMLKTWSNTDIPPNPSKNAQMMILKERALLVTELTSNTPLVSSIIPEMIGFAKDKSIFKSFNGMYNKYENISKILKLEIFSVDLIKIQNEYYVIDVNPSSAFYLSNKARLEFIKINKK